MAERLPFYKQLRYERKLRGWSQEDVASKVGCDLKSVLRWENGKSLPHPYSQQRLCELFGKNAEELGLLGEQAGDIDTVASAMQTSPTQETPSLTEAENNWPVSAILTKRYDVPYNCNDYSSLSSSSKNRES